MPFNAQTHILHNKVISFCIEIEFNKLNNNNNSKAKVFRVKLSEWKDALISKIDVSAVGSQMLNAHMQNARR